MPGQTLYQRYTYVALSYVWGQSRSLLSQINNQAILAQTNSLGSSNSDVGMLIQDTMEFVRRLGQRYLWVDCLCIEQDNAYQKQAQIQHMDIIYAQAVVTVVGITTQNVHSRLPGIGCPLIEPIVQGSDPSATIGIMGPIIDETLEASIYETRGWTYQERLLSQRCLFMTNHGPVFNCPATWRDRWGSFKLTKEINTLPFLHSLPQHFGGSNWEYWFEHYARSVAKYTARSLSHPTDALDAFAGVLQLFQGLLGGEMIGGLPESVLPRALLWIQIDTAVRNRHFPSWSWAGWLGQCAYWQAGTGLFGWTPFGIFNKDPLRSAIADLHWASITPRRKVRVDYERNALQGDVASSERAGSSLNRSLMDVLYFTTEVVDASHFPPSGFADVPSSNGQPTRQAMRLYDAAGNPYGAAVDRIPQAAFKRLLESYSLDNLSYVLLATGGSTPIAQRDLSSSQSVIVQASESALASVDLSYALLVGWSGNYAERIILCSVQKESWEKAPRCRREVALK